MASPTFDITPMVGLDIEPGSIPGIEMHFVRLAFRVRCQPIVAMQIGPEQLPRFSVVRNLMARRKFFFNWQRLGLIDNDFVDIAVAILGGVVCWWLWEKLTRFVAERFAGRSSRAPAITTPKAGSAGLNELV